MPLIGHLVYLKINSIISPTVLDFIDFSVPLHMLEFRYLAGVAEITTLSIKLN
jgi:hypothetical protein